MTQVVKNESQLHKNIVTALIKYFQKQGMTITAAASDGYPEPEKVGRHEPDIIAKTVQGVIAYGEAKTGEGDIGSQHSREQYYDFSNMQMTDSKIPCPLYICVPKEYESELRGVLIEEGLGYKINQNIFILTSG